MHALEQVRHAVQHQKKIAPTYEFLRPLQMQPRVFPTANEQLIHAHGGGNFLERLARISNRERHQDGARPRRDLVDIEPKPIGEKHDLWRNGWDGIVIVLPQKAEINFGESIDLGHPAQFENAFARLCQYRVIGMVSRQLETEVGFDRGADA